MRGKNTNMIRGARLWSRMKGTFLIILIAVISLIIPYFIHIIFGQDSQPDEKSIIEFYGSYLTFIGTFGLGYYIYRNDERHRYNERLNKCKLLYSCINSVEIQMEDLKENIDILQEIRFDRNWKEYFYEFESLVKHHDGDLEGELEYIVKTADQINRALKFKNKNEALKIYGRFLKDEEYETKKYNWDETEEILRNVVFYDNSDYEIIPWYENPDYAKVRKSISEKYYAAAEEWIWNYLNKNGLKVIELKDIEYDIVDWLLTFEPVTQIYNISFDKRMITNILYGINRLIIERSDRINASRFGYWLKES